MLAGYNRAVEVLAQDAQSEGGDVPERTGGDPGHHRLQRVPVCHDSALQTIS